MHIIQVRITIEGDAAYFSAKYAKEADLLFLQENVARMLEVDRANDYVSSWDFDMQFHLKIADMSRNPESFDPGRFRFSQRSHTVSFAGFHPANQRAELTQFSVPPSLAADSPLSIARIRPLSRFAHSAGTIDASSIRPGIVNFYTEVVNFSFSLIR